MANISISKLKENPARAIELAAEYPLAIDNRNKTQAYLIGKELYDNIVSYIENYVDSEAVKAADFTVGTNFEETAEELGI